jgi:hypothetical protein
VVVSRYGLHDAAAAAARAAARAAAAAAATEGCVTASQCFDVDTSRACSAYCSTEPASDR